MENRPEIIGELDYLLTEQDNEASMDIYLNRLMTLGKRQGNKSLTIPLLIAGSLVLYILFGFSLYMSRGTDDTFPGTILALAVCYTALTVFIIISPRIIKSKKNKLLNDKKKQESLEKPLHVRFYSGGFEVYGENCKMMIPYEQFIRVYEAAEGLFFEPGGNIVLFIPVRFFEKQSAERITSHLFEKLGARYIREGSMELPENTENVGAAVMPSDEKEIPEFDISFDMDKRILVEIFRRMTFTKPIIVMAALSAIMLISIFVSIPWIWLDSFVNTMRVIIWLATAALLAVMFLFFNGNMLISSRCEQRYFEDHLTLSDNGNVQKLKYGLIERVFRHGENIVIIFTGNLMTYAPRSAFEDDAQFCAFEKFIGSFASNK